jgi:O-antigen ligase
MESLQSTIPIADGLPRGAFDSMMWRCRQARTPDGEVIWRWIALAFSLYWTLFVAGVYAGMQQLNSVGAVVVLALLGWAALERLRVRMDGVVFASLAAALLPLLNMAGGKTLESGDAVIKHVSLCIVIAASRILRLPPAASSRARSWLAAPVLIVLILCVFVSQGSSWDGGTRHSGLFVNPNTLALIPFLLLFLIERRRDRSVIRIGAHVIVIAVLAFSGTSGALVAYTIGLMTHLGFALPRVWRICACALMVIAGSIGMALIAGGEQTLLPETRLTKQLLVLSTEAQNVFTGGKVNFYDQEQTSGPGSTSGVWRLMQWRLALGVYADGTPAEHILGFGLGSSTTLLGNLPHNEYLRLLLEQGVVGLILFVFVWSRIIMTAPRELRYIGLIFAIYSITENNLDNFPFMSMLALCLSASGTAFRKTIASRASAWREWAVQKVHTLSRDGLSITAG